MDNAFVYAKDNALELEDDYKYTGKDEVCHFDSEKGVVTVKSFTDIPENDGDSLLAAVA